MNVANIFPIFKKPKYGNFEVIIPKDEEEEVEENFDWIESTKKHLEETTDWKSNATKNKIAEERSAEERKNLIVGSIVFLIVLALIIFAIYKIFFK